MANQTSQYLNTISIQIREILGDRILKNQSRNYQNFSQNNCSVQLGLGLSQLDLSCIRGQTKERDQARTCHVITVSKETIGD